MMMMMMMMSFSCLVLFRIQGDSYLAAAEADETSEVFQASSKPTDVGLVEMIHASMGFKHRAGP